MENTRWLLAALGGGRGLRHGGDPRRLARRTRAETVKLEAKVMRVLCLLAARAGGVVSPEELESQVWAEMVVTSDALTNTTIKLRKVFRLPE